MPNRLYNYAWKLGKVTALITVKAVATDDAVARAVASPYGLSIGLHPLEEATAGGFIISLLLSILRLSKTGYKS